MNLTEAKAQDWVAAGFNDVHEVVEGRIFDAWFQNRPYRIEIRRALTGDSEMEWSCSLYERQVLTSSQHLAGSTAFIAIELPRRLHGRTPEDALRAAIHWLGEYGTLGHS